MGAHFQKAVKMLTIATASFKYALKKNSPPARLSTPSPCVGIDLAMLLLNFTAPNFDSCHDSPTTSAGSRSAT